MRAMIVGAFVLVALALMLLATTAHAQTVTPEDWQRINRLIVNDHHDGPLLKTGFVLTVAMLGGDVATTAQAKERGTYYEANIVFRKLFDEPAILGLANGAATGAILYAVLQWHRAEEAWKRHAARVILPMWIVFRGYVVYRNWDLLRETPR